MEEKIYSRLTNWAGLTGIKVFPVTLPTGATLPALVYQVIAASRYTAADRDPGIARSLVQITAFAQRYQSARDTAVQVRLALERWRNDADGILDCYITGEHDLYEPETGIYSRNLTVEVVHREVT